MTAGDIAPPGTVGAVPGQARATGNQVPPDDTPPADGPPVGDLPPGGRALATVAGAVPVLLGLVTIGLAKGLGFGTLTDPGPGLWPMIVAMLLVLTGVAIVLGARRATDTEAFTRQATVVVIAVASLALYAFLFELVGFEIPTVLLLALWLKVFGRESWRSTVVVSVVSTAAVYALFISALGVPLPHLVVF